MFVSTNLCSLVNTVTNVAIPISSCISDSNKRLVIVTLANSQRLPNLNLYSLIINGISIASN